VEGQRPPGDKVHVGSSCGVGGRPAAGGADDMTDPCRLGLL